MKLAAVFCDNGKEFVNDYFLKFLEEKHAIMKNSVPHEPSHNGRIERANRTLKEAVRSMLAAG